MAYPEWLPVPKILQRRRIPDAEKRPALPAGGEISLRDSLLYPKGAGFYPWNPDVFIRRKGGMTIYDKMRRDGMVKSCQYIKRLAVVCSGWSMEAASEEGVDVEAADFVTQVFKRIKGTLENDIKEILSAYDYGFSVTEKVWELIADGDFRGKVGLKSLKSRKPHGWDFETDEYGNLRPMGLWQQSGAYKYNPGKFVIYSHNREFDNWYGLSDLQAAYPHWWSKDVIMKYWNIFLEKFSMGIPYLHPAEGTTQIQDSTYTDLKNALFNLQFTSAIAQKSNDATIDILESKRRAAGEYNVAISYHDRSIARSLLMPTGLGYTEDEQKGGSYARSKKHFDLWLWIVQDCRRTMEEVFNEQVVPELVAYNYAVSKPPLFKFNALEHEEVEALAKLWLEAISGKAVHPTASDENALRRLIKFPERDEDELREEWETEKAAKEEMRQARIRGQLNPRQPQPANVIPFPGTEKQNAQYARRWQRDLTPYEKRVDFKRVEKALDDIESSTRLKLQNTFTKQRDKFLVSFEKAAKNDSINAKWINSINLQYQAEIQATISYCLTSTFELGRRDSRTEIMRAKEKHFQQPIVKLPPRKTMEMLQKQAFWIKNITMQQLIKEIQALLITMLETGEVPAETMKKIEAIYEPYIGDEQVIRDQKQIEPYRIETLIRTNTTKAYNTGKMVEYNNPELEGFVRAVQLSAVLDTRTTDICRDADGKIFMLDDPQAGKLTPPLHFQCRTIVVPITVVDGQFEPSKTVELTEVLQQMPPSFGGTVDRP